jgi:hypothetical protein
MKIEHYPALLWTSYLSKEIKEDAKISWDYPFKDDMFTYIMPNRGSQFLVFLDFQFLTN